MTTSLPPAGFRLDGRVALITGGASGIGLAVAQRFADAGAVIALSDLRKDAVEREAVKLRDAGHRAIGVAGDAGDPRDVKAVVDHVLAELGAIDVLVNSAGVMGPTKPIEKISDEEWAELLRIDLTSVFLMSREVVPHMKVRRRGSIVSLASIAGKEGTPNLIPYSVAKAGIIAFTKALGKELIPDGIRVNCVAPGVVQTPLLDQLSPATIQVMLSKSPMGRFGTADEVATVVLFLASDAASFVTAQCSDVSGGRATY